MFKDGKAGLQGLDGKKINEIINDTTRGSRFYNHKLAKQLKIEQQVEAMKKKLKTKTEADHVRARKEVQTLKQEFIAIGRDMTHVIVHIDMDAFFASIEERDDPSLQGKPMAVGTMAMLSTSNYISRQYGIHPGLPGFLAKKLCPQLKIISHGMGKYQAESKKVAEVVRRYDPQFQPSSLDECSIDLTAYLMQRVTDSNGGWQMEAYQNEDGDLVYPAQVWEKAEEIVHEIRQSVFERTQLTCSAGIAPNKMLAKICSDLRKPNNQYCLYAKRSADLQTFIGDFNIKKIPGCGPVQQQILKGLDIENCAQLFENLDKLCLLFTANAIDFYVRASMGISSYSYDYSGTQKSESRETTFTPTEDLDFLLATLKDLSASVARSLQKDDTRGKTITLKIKHDNFLTNVRCRTIASYTNDAGMIFEVGHQLLKNECIGKKLKLRLIGIRVSNFLDQEENANKQTSEQGCQKTIDRFLSKASSTSSGQSSLAENLVVETLIAQETESLKKDAMQKEQNMQASIATPSGQEQSHVKPSSTSFVCPVCSIRRCVDLDDLNAHIDYCLSRDAILSSVCEADPFHNEQPKAFIKTEEGIHPIKKVPSKRKLLPSPDKPKGKMKRLTDYFK